MPKWFNKLKRESRILLSKGKDRALSSSLASFFINRTRINRYGKLLKLELDSIYKEASFSLLLLGEDVPIEVDLSYETRAGDSEYSLIITAASISRNWMDKIVQNYFIGRQLPIPKELYTVLN